jgi:1-deoxy-D-xylulose-5-phosphate synthase
MRLAEIKGPEDLKDLSTQELKALAEELRETIIQGVAEGGGHLASSLGVVELTLALHTVFDTPKDKIVWDVGHQSYPHKLLTGRYGAFPTLRKRGGIAGFPRRSESAHDAFGTGHSSTSISAALGMVEARDLLGEDYRVLAVIGDGAMTAGLAFEGLNHAGQLKKDLIVVLNDNEMSISPNVGALSAYLNRILTGEVFRRFRRETKHLLESIPRVGGSMARFAEKAEESLKGLFLPGVLFEELGFTYVGPIEGHDVASLVETFRNVRQSEGPVLVHVITTKGKGYEFSEREPSAFHGVGPFEPETGTRVSGGGMSYSEVFGRCLVRMADKDERVVAITAAMCEGTGLSHFAESHPGRFYDVGIAEPHAVTFAAGLAAEGVRPVVAVYSTFLQRSYDEIIHDVCLQNLPVVFAIDRAGIVGEDGPTHQGVFDLSYLRHIPNLAVMAPRDARELESMMALALEHEGPSAVRYPRGTAPEGPPLAPLRMGRAEVLAEGRDLAVLAVGSSVLPALGAAGRLAEEGIRARVVNVRFVKPMDEETVRGAAALGRVLTVEENALMGGFGSAVLEFLNREGMGGVAVSCLGIPDEYVEQGTQQELRAQYGLDEEGIARAARVLYGGVSVPTAGVEKEGR